MTTKPDRFLIKVQSGSVKPQQKMIALDGQPWEIEWSVSSDVPMSVDSFNLTIGKYLRATGEQKAKKIEEYWRVTGIPGNVQKIHYGDRLSEAVCAPSKPLEDAVFVIKISGMSVITEGLKVETCAGVAVVKLTLGVAESIVSSALSDKEKSETATPVLITNDVLVNLLNLSEDDEPPKEA